MADVNNSAGPTFPTKRAPVNTENPAIESKKQKLETPDNNGKEAPEPLEQTLENDVVQKGKGKAEEKLIEDEEEEKGFNGKAVIDRKGKGILIEEDEEDDDDSDDSDSDDSVIGGEFSDDSDFVEDPLAEVDLDNILPSRTRRKTINPGAYLATDIPAEDSDESDDPDA
ncbi:hypothetical protein SOVF_024080 [Spinacia oleracea]|uniref:Histone H2A.Z-specific chaperone CHZ1 n=1 Tax=Spinacia oleracea TaxID=3562 RepID=A0A9R0JIT3_SPIOL|nr:histone H2A.Z-specific chaperone CHZ1 [Spinacia oleracea]KNA23518.1 hypothetical protein SOVF_024080 [Spinacia oleracea]